MPNEAMIKSEKIAKMKSIYFDFKRTFLILIFNIIIILIISSFLMNQVEAKSIIVDDDGGTEHIKIQDAIDAANDWDTIFVYSGTYNESILVNKSLNIIGNSSTNTIINGGGNGDVVKIISNFVNFSGFQINNGSNLIDNAGIKIENSENCMISDVNSTGNNNYGIFLNNSNSSIKNSIIRDNFGTGIYLRFDQNCNEFSPRLENLIVENNSGYGIEIYSINNVDTNSDVNRYYYPTIINSEFINNSNYGMYFHSYARNGMYWWSASSSLFPIVENCSIFNCRGGIISSHQNGYHGSSFVYISLIDTEIFNNTEYGVYLQDVAVKEKNSSVISNDLFDWFGNGYTYGNWTWSNESTYNFTGTIEIKSGHLLTIEPGTVITFGGENTRLLVQGTINATGFEEDRIIFTTNIFPEDEGQWQGIYFNESSPGIDCKIEYSNIYYAKIGIECYNTSPSISHVNINNCSDGGIKLLNFNGIIMSSNIKDNNGNGIYLMLDRKCNYYSPRFENLNVEGNKGYGIEIYAINDADIYSNDYRNYYPEIINSTFQMNSDYGMNFHSYARNKNYWRSAVVNLYISIENCNISNCYGGLNSSHSNGDRGTSYVNITLKNSQIHNNTKNGVNLQDTGIEEENTIITNNSNADWYGQGYTSGNWKWYKKSTYIFTGTIAINKDHLLDIESGTKAAFEGANSRLLILGKINATGHEFDRIKITSNYKIQKEGQWMGIYFEDSSSDENCILKYVDISFANTGIECNLAKPQLEYLTIHHCSEIGIYLHSIEEFRIINSIINYSKEGVHLLNCNDIEIFNCSLSYNSRAVWIDMSNSNIINSTIDNCDYDFYLERVSEHTSLNTTFDNTKVYFYDEHSKLSIKWYLNILIKDRDGFSVQGAEVKLIDNNSNEETYNTDQEGLINWIIFKDFVIKKARITNYMPYIILVTKDIYFNETILKIKDSVNITILLTELTTTGIYDINVAEINENTIKISWTTEQSSTSQIEYGTSKTYDKITEKDEVLVTNHNVTITDLITSTIYHFRILSEDASSFQNVSGDQTFKISETSIPNIHIDLELNTLKPHEGEEVKITGIANNNGNNIVTIDIVFLDNDNELKTELNKIIEAKTGFDFHYFWNAQGVGDHIIKFMVKYNNKEILNTTKEIVVREKVPEQIYIDLIIEIETSKPRDGDVVDISASITNNGDSGILTNVTLMDGEDELETQYNIPIFAKRVQSVLFKWSVKGKGPHDLKIIVEVNGVEVLNKTRTENVRARKGDDGICSFGIISPLFLFGVLAIKTGKKVKKK